MPSNRDHPPMPCSRYHSVVSGEAARLTGRGLLSRRGGSRRMPLHRGPQKAFSSPGPTVGLLFTRASSGLLLTRASSGSSLHQGLQRASSSPGPPVGLLLTRASSGLRRLGCGCGPPEPGAEGCPHRSRRSARRGRGWAASGGLPGPRRAPD